MIKYLVSRKGLECMYNCQDKGTPNYKPITCEEKWKLGGEKVWTYGSNFQGDGDYAIGEIVLFDDTSLLPWMGDVSPNQYWINTRVGVGTTGNPYGVGGAQGFWTLCRDDKVFTETTNYLDNFFKFATRYCKSCNPCSFVVGNENSFTIPTESFAYSSDDEGNLTVGGIFLEIDGEDIR